MAAWKNTSSVGCPVWWHDFRGGVRFTANFDVIIRVDYYVISCVEGFDKTNGKKGNKTWVTSKLAAAYAEKLGYSKEQFIRLSFQDIIDRDNLNVVVDISPKIRKNKSIKHRVSGE